MGDDDSGRTALDLGGTFGAELLGNGLVRKSMETVAAYPVGLERTRESVATGWRNDGAVEGGIETGELPQIRSQFADAPYRIETGRLVKWRERSKCLNAVEYIVIDLDWVVELGPAMDDPVSNCIEVTVTELISGPIEQAISGHDVVIFRP